MIAVMSCSLRKVRSRRLVGPRDAAKDPSNIQQKSKYATVQTPLMALIRPKSRINPETISGEALELVDMFEPVTDGQPPSVEQLDRMAHFIEEQIETWERPVVVTCHAGMGRTGTALAAFMVYVGYLPQNAIDFIRALRPGSIESAGQEAAVNEYAEFLKEKERERRRKAIQALDDI